MRKTENWKIRKIEKSKGWETAEFKTKKSKYRNTVKLRLRKIKNVNIEKLRNSEIEKLWNWETENLENEKSGIQKKMENWEFEKSKIEKWGILDIEKLLRIRKIENWVGNRKIEYSKN